MWDNCRLVGKIPTQADVKEELPLNKTWNIVVEESKNEIKKILSWNSEKKIIILWPCSADFKESLEEYWSFIEEMRKKYNDKMEIIMRFYTGKPRTIWGWKWISNSRPGDAPDIARWIMDSRELAIHLIEKYKIPLADEMLHPQLHNMFNDIYSYLAIWARSTENQWHREVASWSAVPTGFKNPQSWDIDVMTNSIKAWQTPSTYTILENIYDSTWNMYSHWILRWWRMNGVNFSNYDEVNLKSTSEMLVNKWIKNPSFLVDTNHENSDKQYEKQIEIMIAVFDNINNLKNKWVDISPYFKWFMTESYLTDWRQNWPEDDDISKIKKWRSLTDPCIWLEKTKIFLEEMYNRL